MNGPPRVLVTGFEPFGGSALNPSEAVVRQLALHAAGDAHAAGGAHAGESASARMALRTAVLPVVGGVQAGSAWHALHAALQAHQPQVVLCLGEAHTRSQVCVERVARNVRTYRIPDAAGVQVAGVPVLEGAAAEHHAALPAHPLCLAVQAAGVPCQPSDDAGTYLCNEVLFQLLHHRHTHGWPQFAGFVHLPQLPEQAAVRPVHATPMPLESMVQAVHTMLDVLLKSELKS